MKLVFIFTFISLLHASASSLSQTISINVQNQPIEKVFESIEKQTKLTFVYNDRFLKPSTPVSIKVSNTPLNTVLQKLLDPISLTYHITQNTIVITGNAIRETSTTTLTSTGAQQRTITGKVTNELGHPLEGVTVALKGSSLSTTTDLQGEFSFVTRQDGDILVFSAVGFKSQEQLIGEQKNYNIVLKELVSNIDEVVVVGYGTQKRTNVSGSVASVNFEKEIAGRPIMNASSALAGLAPGLQVMQGSGAPGSDGATLRIRGTTTINNSNPLVLIDGFEADLNTINPHDIATISVLKDAASSAIYGSRAANGVILVTTKKGSGKTSIQYNMFQSFQQPINMLNLVSDYADHMEYINEGRRNTEKPNIFSTNSIQAWRDANKNPDGLNEYGVPNHIAYPNTDWFREIFNNGTAQEHNLSLQGSQESVRYLVSTSFLENNGIMKDSDLQRYQARANLEVDVNSWWTAGARLFGLQQQKGIANLSRGFEFLWQATPGIYPGEDNKWGIPALTNEESSNANNVFEKMVRAGHDKMFRGNITLFSNFHITKGLNIEASFNYAPDFGDYATWSVENGRWDYVEDKLVSESALENGDIYNSSFKRRRVTGDLVARYSTVIDDKHDIGALAGYNQQYYNENNFDARKRGMTDWSLHVLNTGVELQGINGSETDWALRSFFGRLNYGFMSKYLFEANLRYDESSRFGPNKRGGYFPSFSAAWRITEEPFFRYSEDSFLNELKLRAS